MMLRKPHDFSGCVSLRGVYFLANAPSFDADVFLNVVGGYKAILYYLPGTTGWKQTIADRQTMLWTPKALTSDSGFGVRTNQFRFSIFWASDKVIVVEAATNLFNPIWSPVATNTLNGTSSYFTDSEGTNYPARFYRVRSP